MEMKIERRRFMAGAVAAGAFTKSAPGTGDIGDRFQEGR